MKISKRVGTVAKSMIGVGILVLLLRNMDMGTLLDTLKTIDIFWVAFSMVPVMLVRVLMAMRWHVVLKAYQIVVSIPELTIIILISQSLGHLLPGGVGIDVIRGQQLVRRHGHIAEVSGTIVLDRLLGLYSMFFLALCCIPLAPSGTVPVELTLFLVVVNAGCIAAAAFLYFLRSMGVQLPLPKAERFTKINKGIKKVLAVVSDAKTMKKIFLPIFSLSILVQILRSAVFYYLFIAAGIDLPFIYFLVFIPLVFFAILMPISIGGLGVREGALILFFAPFGVSAEICVTVGLIWHGTQIAALLPGLALFALRRDQVSVDQK